MDKKKLTLIVVAVLLVMAFAFGASGLGLQDQFVSCTPYPHLVCVEHPA